MFNNLEKEQHLAAFKQVYNYKLTLLTGLTYFNIQGT